MNKHLKSFILKIPESVGVGIGIGLLGIQVPMAILALLAPGYDFVFETVLPRWAIFCTVCTLIYFWDKTAKEEKTSMTEKEVSEANTRWKDPKYRKLAKKWEKLADLNDKLS